LGQLREPNLAVSVPYREPNLLLTRNVGIRRDIRDFGVFGVDFVVGGVGGMSLLSKRRRATETSD
jgi:hypothetical protein